MYTDGLSEARDDRGEFFPISSIDAELRSGSVERAIEQVVAAVSRHVSRGRLEDDLALVVIEHLAGPTPARPDNNRTNVRTMS
jgi:serine phosphatase RsbU (regulator of sigma subunit)